MPGSAQSSSRADSQPRAADAAVVIVNYRTAELSEHCLESVAATAGALTLEMVIVDNASGDGGPERLRASCPQASVVEMSHNLGFAAGVNAGFRHTATELVMVLNPDSELRAGSLEALLAHMRAHPRTGVLAPLVEHPDGRLAPNGYRRFPNLALLALDLCVPVGYALEPLPALHPYVMSPASLRAGERPAWVSGAVMLVRRAAYEQAGPLDEGFFLYFEETEWQERVLASGWGIEVLPHARACHLMRGGGEAAHSHSPYFLASAVRYLRMRGTSARLARGVLSVSLALSWAFLRVIACLPSKRGRASVQARAYGALLRAALTGALAP